MEGTFYNRFYPAEMEEVNVDFVSKSIWNPLVTNHLKYLFVDTMNKELHGDREAPRQN